MKKDDFVTVFVLGCRVVFLFWGSRRIGEKKNIWWIIKGDLGVRKALKNSVYSCFFLDLRVGIWYLFNIAKRKERKRRL